MERLDQPIMPKFNLGICECIGSAVRRVLDLGTTTELCLSEHNRGATVSLDDALDDNQGTLEFPEGFGF